MRVGFFDGLVKGGAACTAPVKGEMIRGVMFCYVRFKLELSKLLLIMPIWPPGGTQHSVEMAGSKSPLPLAGWLAGWLAPSGSMSMSQTCSDKTTLPSPVDHCSLITFPLLSYCSLTTCCCVIINLVLKF